MIPSKSPSHEAYSLLEALNAVHSQCINRAVSPNLGEKEKDALTQAATKLLNYMKMLAENISRASFSSDYIADSEQEMCFKMIMEDIAEIQKPSSQDDSAQLLVHLDHLNVLVSNYLRSSNMSAL